MARNDSTRCLSPILSLLVQSLGALANAALAQGLAAPDGKCLACSISDKLRQARQAGGCVGEVARRILEMLCYGSIESVLRQLIPLQRRVIDLPLLLAL